MPPKKSAKVDVNTLRAGLKVFGRLPSGKDEEFIAHMPADFTNLLHELMMKHAAHAHPSLHPHIAKVAAANTYVKRRNALIRANKDTGGSFLGFLKDVGNKVVDAGKAVANVVSKVPSAVADPLIKLATDKGAKIATNLLSKVM